MNRLRLLTCIGLLLWSAAQAAPVPTLLDWDTNAWPGSSLSETYTIGAGDVQINWTGDTGAFFSGRPVTAQSETGGLSPAEDSLSLRVNYGFGSPQNVTATIDFTHPGGVTDVSFTVFDVDTRTSGFNQWQDQVIVTATDGVSTFNPSSVSVVDPTFVSFDGVNTVTGQQDVPSSTSALGNATFTFNQPGITRVTFVWRNPPGLFTNSGIQYISLHDINFTYEEPAPNLTALKSVSTVRDPLGASTPAALAVPGAVVEYQVSITNSGTADAEEVVVTDTLAGNLTFLQGDYNGATSDVEIIVGASPPVFCIAEAGGDTNADGCFRNGAGNDLSVTIPVSGGYPTGLTIGTTAPDNVVVVRFRATVN